MIFFLISVLAAPAVVTPPATIYVSPQGNDLASGKSPRTPFKTLDRAKAALSAAGGGTAYLMDGVFDRAAVLLIPALSSAQQWRAMPGAHPVLDGGNRVDSAIGIGSNDVEISGLEIRNFLSNGIVVSGGARATISHNYIHDISSSGWNQAGILGMQVSPDLVIDGNRLSNLNYAGIQLAASDKGDLSNPLILNNDIQNSCRVIPDCGAIYLSGRTPKSAKAIVERNKILNYGPANHETKAIYLDDGLSGAIVRRNNIIGSGSYAVQIHGGQRNLIEQNVIFLMDAQKALFYQGWNGPMVGNRFIRNEIHTSLELSGSIKYAGTVVGPDLEGNILRKSRK